MSVDGDFGVEEGLYGRVAVVSVEAVADPVGMVGAVCGFDGEVVDGGCMLDRGV